MCAGRLDRAWMEVVADEVRIWERLCHQDGGPAMPASDIGHLGATGQLVDYPIQRGKPGIDQIVVVAGSEEARHCAEHAAVLAPGDTPAGPECRLDFGLV